MTSRVPVVDQMRSTMKLKNLDNRILMSSHHPVSVLVG